MWQGYQQEEIKGSAGMRGFHRTRIGLHLQGSTLEVHERDYSIEQLHEEMIKILYYHDALLSGSVQGTSGACAELDSKWSKGCHHADQDGLGSWQDESEFKDGLVVRLGAWYYV